MKYEDKTKEELINEIKELQKNYNSIVNLHEMKKMR